MASYLRLLRRARGLIGPIAGSAVSPLIVTATDLTLLALLARFVDQAIRAAPGAALRLVFLAFGLVVIRESASYLGGRLGVRASSELVERLQNDLYAHAHGLSLDFFFRVRPGDLAARLFHDADAASHLVTQVTVAALDTPVRLGGLLIAVWWLDPLVAWGAALVTVPGIIVSRLVARRVRQGCVRLYQDLGALYDRAIESLNAIELVKSLGREREEMAAFAAHNRALVTRQVAVERLKALEGPFGQGLRWSALLVVFAYGNHQITAGRLSPGQLTAVLVAVYAFLGALESLFALHAEAQSGFAAAERYFAVLDEVPTVRPPAIGRRATFVDALAFENVGFAYPGRGPLFEGVSFDLRRGEHVGLVGPMGSGKTTLLRLALRLLDPTRGRIALDGVDLRELTPSSVIACYAVVTQDVVLLDGSIRDNVAWGQPGAPEPAVTRAIVQTGLDRIASRFPEGLATIVGPRGATLSAGERQRVAFARAAVRDATIYLFDEITSALDPAGEQEVQVILSSLCRDRAVLVISHRPSGSRRLDRILELRHGRLTPVAEDRQATR